MAGQVIERDRLGVLTKIAQGGQGVVYQAPNAKTKFAASMVYKEYKPQVRADIDFTALAAMPALVEQSLSYAQAEQLISIAAWPCAMVEDGSTPTGFVMPTIPQQFFIALTTVKGSSTAAAEFAHLLNHPTVLRARGISVDDAQRYTLLREAASGLAFLHKQGVCVGDISPKNLLFALTPDPAVYFIDCDAMRINSVSVLPQVETPGWQVPAEEELATIYSDTYKLGLLALRLLVGDHDTTNPAHLPFTTPDLLRQAITDTLTNPPQRRPLPDAWNYVLGNAIEQAQNQQKTATPTPASIAAAPPIPVVRSRPSPPTPQFTPSTPPQVWSRPTPPVINSVPPLMPTATVGYAPVRSPVRGKPGRRKFVIIAALVVVLAAVAGTTGYLMWGRTSRQTVLPITDLNQPRGVAVDTAGNVYVADSKNNRVLKLAAGSSNQTELPFTGLSDPRGLAVDTAGNVYVTDFGDHKVLKLAGGSSNQTELPFTGLSDSQGLAVDTAGDVYVTDGYNNRVLKLAAGSSVQTELPFTHLAHPVGVAVDSLNNVYVADGSQVVELVAGSLTRTTLPFTGIGADAVAVDSAGVVYVSDSLHGRVLKLEPGQTTPTVLSFTGLNLPTGVAVDTAGNMYVADLYLSDVGNNRVVELPRPTPYHIQKSG
jgi:sugar lactone lactonase YvrE/serine/threonine protein kinase